MPYLAFGGRFPEIASRETRTVVLQSSSPFRLPAGEYALLELYCDEAGCDCRRVLFWVERSGRASPEAVVAYGWESADFYARWLGEDDPAILRELKGPALNFGSPQSALAPEILRLVEDVVLRDRQYVERVRRHYELFRRRIDEQTNTARGKRRGRGRDGES